MKRLPSLAACALGVVVACGSEYGDEPATPAPADADAGANDASAPSLPETSALGFCASLSPKPTFCSDFDDGAVPGPWDALIESGNATLRLDRDGVVSGPFAALLRANANEANRGSGLQKTTLPAPTKRMQLAFDLRVDEFPNIGDADLDVLFLTFGLDAAAAFELQTQLNADGTIELHTQGGPGGAADTPVKLPRGVFTRIGVNIDLANARATMAFDGTVVGAGVAFAPSSVSPTVYIGDPFIGRTTGSWSVRIDNVVIQIDGT